MTAIRRRVVVTAIGAICGAGPTANAIIDSTIRGRSAMRPISRFDARQHPARIAAEISHSLEPGADPYVAWGIHAATETVRSAGANDDAHADRIGVYLGTAFGCIANREQAWMDVLGERSVNDLGPSLMGADLASHVRSMIGAAGPVLTLNSAF